MKLFLDTSNLKDITYWHQTGMLDGITTNPTNLSKEGKDVRRQIQEICSVMKGYDVSVEVTEIEPHLVYKQAKAIAVLSDNVVVKIPCHRDYYPVIDKLVKEGVAVNVTLVFTLIQGMLMAKLGVRYISPFVGRLNDAGGDGIALLEDLSSMIDYYEYTQTSVLAASIRSVEMVHNAILAGADVATLPAQIFKEMTEHPLIDKGMQLFLDDWKKLGVTQFP